MVGSKHCRRPVEIEDQVNLSLVTIVISLLFDCVSGSSLMKQKVQIVFSVSNFTASLDLCWCYFHYREFN